MFLLKARSSVRSLSLSLRETFISVVARKGHSTLDFLLPFQFCQGDTNEFSLLYTNSNFAIFSALSSLPLSFLIVLSLSLYSSHIFSLSRSFSCSFPLYSSLNLSRYSLFLFFSWPFSLSLSLPFPSLSVVFSYSFSSLFLFFSCSFPLFFLFFSCPLCLAFSYSPPLSPLSFTLSHFLSK